ncbi:hypothetical protein CoNPh26_CDS0105 [Staphylococcus phage S-CoN_Ph26]|nr:hypothetical protein CoNPh26_CDS0105 [Staphylococcus phage S-CoN_Ph26]
MTNLLQNTQIEKGTVNYWTSFGRYANTILICRAIKSTCSNTDYSIKVLKTVDYKQKLLSKR